MQKNVSIILAVLILAFGLTLRARNYATWPREGATFDEYAWTWLGISLLKTGVPTSWSPHPAYRVRVPYVNPRGARFTLVTPYLEHPPLFGLIAGGYAWLSGERSFDAVTIPVIRQLALLLGALSVLGVYALAGELYGVRTGLIAEFLYSIIPTVAIGSRIVQNENFFIPAFLFVLYAVVRYTKTGSRRALWGALIGSSLLPLAKIPWIAAPAAVSLILWYRGKKRETVWVILGALGSIALYVLYGLTASRDVFLSLARLQLARYDMNFDSVFALFQAPYLADRFFTDGWIYVGWVAMAVIMLKDLRKHHVVSFSFFAYFMVYLFAIPNEPGHGWYRYPMYPFLAIALALTFEEFFNRAVIPSFLGLQFVGLSLLANVWAPAFGFSYVVYRAFIGLGAVSLAPLFLAGKRYAGISRHVNRAMLLAVIALSVWAILAYNEQ